MTTETNGTDLNASSEPPESVPESLGSIFRRLPPVPDRARSRPDDDADRKAAVMAWKSLEASIGPRYSLCRFSNFFFDADPDIAARQAAMVDRLKRYAESIDDYVKAGSNLILFGRPGTGKDHLLAALMREACKAGIAVKWLNGMRLFERRRDSIDKSIGERELLREYETAPVLAISDPVPPWGDLERGQAEFLFRLIDERYRHMRPVWITANFSGGKDAEKRMGAQVVDRLRDGGLALDCDWHSYRKAAS